MDLEQRPILVTGVHRSGTTWVGKMLAASGEAAYISEPLNVWHRRGVLNVDVPYWYLYLCSENEEKYLSAFKELLSYRYGWIEELRSLRSLRDLARMTRDGSTFLLGRLFHRRPLLKDPFAVFSIPWFIERFACQVVVTLRHPAAFASSLRRLGWSFNMGNLLAQPLLIRDHLGPYEAQMRACLAQPDNLLQQAGLLWVMVYQTVRSFVDQGYPIYLVRHEDLASNPVGRFQELYQWLGLSYTEKARWIIERSSSAENPKELAKGRAHSIRLDSRSSVMNWQRRLTAEEVEQIKSITWRAASHYYPAESWV
ncbi:MAG: sulfotransferase [Anaerolineales bacterium]|nr:sulfotransferase [Anaerolineales bacterium]MCS7248409.1 sulfotransferase [Anaerolineales bacterium]MDW8162222.1 sulfotransferase [Anaerolineales bacterium]MDW8446391.1 sulfotransferase [Anaerolineales bacterium]